MGNTYSKAYNDEKPNWSRHHSLNVQQDRARTCIELIDTHLLDEEIMQMKTSEITLSGVTFDHYYVWTKRSPQWILEFGGGSITTNRVVFHSNPPADYGSIRVEKEFRLTNDVKERMKRVVGATNYSLALRNCEHVARYVYSGAWICMQMSSEKATLGGLFLRSLMNEGERHKLNELPTELKESTGVPETILEELEPIISFEKQVDGLFYHEDAYNILVLGPTGSGKSQFINRLFNKTVCPVASSAVSVTRHLITYQGRITLLSGQEKNANVIDSVGFCDSTLTKQEVFAITKQYIEDRVQKIDKVVVLVSGRIERPHVDAISQILHWLKFWKEGAFVNYLFIYNKADQCNLAERERNVAFMSSQLNTGNLSGVEMFGDNTRIVRFNVPLGIPPAAPKDVVEEQLDSIRIQLDQYFVRNKPQRITVSPQSCVIL